MVEIYNSPALKTWDGRQFVVTGECVILTVDADTLRGADLSGGRQLPLCGTRNDFSAEREYGMNYITRRLLRLGIGVILGGGFVVVYHAITGHLPKFLR